MSLIPIGLARLLSDWSQRARPLSRGHRTVGDGVSLGAGCTVLGDVAVGSGATVGARAIVTRSVPPGAVVVGVNRLRTATASGSSPANRSAGAASEREQAAPPPHRSRL